MNQLILEVFCRSSFDDKPELLAVTLNQDLVKRLLNLVGTLNAINVHSLEILSPEGHWLSEDNLSDDAVEQPISDLTTSQIFSKLKDKDEAFKGYFCSMELNKIKVMSDSVRFFATPKHCGEEFECYSDKITASQLKLILETSFGNPELDFRKCKCGGQPVLEHEGDKYFMCCGDDCGIQTKEVYLEQSLAEQAWQNEETEDLRG